MNEVKEKKKIGLTTKIFIALIAGAIVGIALNMFAADVDFVQNVLVNGIFYVVGQGFIRLMQMLRFTLLRFRRNEPDFLFFKFSFSPFPYSADSW